MALTNIVTIRKSDPSVEIPAYPTVPGTYELRFDDVTGEAYWFGVKSKTFTKLLDTPDSYALKAGYQVVVNATETGLTLVAPSVSTVTNTPYQTIITQSAHGFVLPVYGFIPVHFNGTSWAAADTSAEDNVTDAFITDVIDTNSFIIMMEGFVDVPAHGLTPGQYYYLQDSGLIGTSPDTEIDDAVCFVISTDRLALLRDRPAKTA